MNLRTTDRITLAGLPGTGKTTLGKYLASLCEPNILIYDPLAQYTGFPNELRHIPRSDSLTEFDGVCKQLRARGNVTFFIDEAERYLAQGKPLLENTFDLVNRGRNWGVGMVAITRRIQRLSKDYFDLCQKCFFFRCGLKSKAYIADMVGNEVFSKVRSLPQYHFMLYDVESEEYSIHVLRLGVRPTLDSPKGEIEKDREE